MKNIFICIIIILLLFNCNKDSAPGENFHAADNYNRSIQINSYYYTISADSISILSDVEIEIFSNRENFLQDIYPDATRVTDSNGYALFDKRDKIYYWIIASHPTYGIKIDSVSTPANTYSFVQIYF